MVDIVTKEQHFRLNADRLFFDCDASLLKIYKGNKLVAMLDSSVILSACLIDGGASDG